MLIRPNAAVLLRGGQGHADAPSLSRAPRAATRRARLVPIQRLPTLVFMAVGSLSASAVPLGLPAVPIPTDNPQNPAKIALGDKLFHDPRLSATGQISCATCHQDAKAFTDSPLSASRGVGDAQGLRNAPSVVNAAFYSSQFWDGRAGSLEEQALQPLVDPVEMGLSGIEAALSTLRADADYARRFEQAFGVPGPAITARELSQAIASYERTLVFGDTPFDRYQFQGDKQAMTPAAIRGLAVFQTRGRCVLCHRIEKTHATFTDNRFHNIGIGSNRYPEEIERMAIPQASEPPQPPAGPATPAAARLRAELGRFAVTGQVEDIGAFKTPALRNVAVTAPYMHDGSLKTLRDVVLHYATGGFSPGDRKRNAHLDPEIQHLEVSAQQLDDLLAFLEALTSPAFGETRPTRP